MKVKRALYLTHRWLGIALCLFMLMWFVSGVVMMYVGYPKLTPAERLNALPQLPACERCIPASEAIAATSHAKAPVGVRLTSVAGLPRYIVRFEDGKVIAVDAINGSRIRDASASDALASARAFVPNTNARYVDLVNEDAWTHSAALRPFRPLHRVDMDDAAGTRLYIASNTGEVVRDATRTERNWNWVGAWIHWLYPFRGGALDKHWHDIVVYVSLIGTALAVVGLVVGVLRWRFNGTFKSGSHSPYGAGWMKWHHLTGLLFGVLTITFIFSGLMSMNPWKVFDTGAPRLDQRVQAASPFKATSFDQTPASLVQKFAAAGLRAVELEWRTVGNEPFAIAYNSVGQTKLLSLASKNDTTGAQPASFDSFQGERLTELGATLLPSHRVTSSRMLREYDFYYYSREPHTMTGANSRPLPVLQLKFDDPHETWIYMDPRTGSAVMQSDSGRRWSRWLFALLHSFDWLPLLDRRPAWDLWMIAISTGGAIVSLTGIVVGWRRLRGRTRRTANGAPALTLPRPR